jgi:Zn-dependent M16 (insulinase) family peptidase
MDNKENRCQEILGWRVVRTGEVNLPKANFVELEHSVTGARYIHLGNDSVENVFAVALKTIPEDSSGVAHILEHTVLAGSEKYPVRDPFFSMLKRSLQTFMNAFTASDWTAYPFASPNKKDFYNLMSVYLDAVFFPRIEKRNFLQEGWRYGFGPAGPSFEGVVYNEMKGAMSSPDRVFEEAINTGLYAEAPYHYNTGGDPAEIPSLTHEALRAFHAKYYHPSNAYFFSYGNLPLADSLKMVNDNVLSRFERSGSARIVPESRWTEPRHRVSQYVAAEKKDGRGECQTALAWLMADSRDNLEVFGLELLEDVLFGNSAAPMRQALLDSGLGSDLCDACGYDSELNDTRFVIGLKDVKQGDLDKVEELIMSKLEELANEGIDEDLVESVIKNNEIRKRHLSNQPYPLGLQVFLDIVSSWTHGGDALGVLDFDGLLLVIKERVAVGGFFEGLIRKYLLENKHRLRTDLLPDHSLGERLEKEEQGRLAKRIDSMDEDAIKQLKEEAEGLLALQEEEDLSCLPKLGLEDIDKNVSTATPIPGGIDNLRLYDKDANGLLYLTAITGIGGGGDTSPAWPLLAYLLTHLGTDKRNYADLAKRIDHLCGGLVFSPRSATRLDGVHSDILAMQTYGLTYDLAELIHLVQEMIAGCDLSDTARIKMLVNVLYSELHSSIVEQGNAYAAMLALAPLSHAGRINELWHGIGQLSFLRDMKKQEGDFVALREMKERLGKKRFEKIALIGNKDDVESKVDVLRPLLGAEAPFGSGAEQRDAVSVAIAVPTAVSFVAAAKRVVNIEHADAPALLVGAKLASRSFLHREIREKRGAYGASARFDMLEGTWTFSSYRDPHILSTLDAFVQTRDFLGQARFSEQEVEEAIISVSSDIERPDTETEQAKRAFARELIGLHDEIRRSFRESLLSVKRSDIARVGEKYLNDSWQEYSVAVISSEEKICTANKKLGREALSLSRLD